MRRGLVLVGNQVVKYATSVTVTGRALCTLCPPGSAQYATLYGEGVERLYLIGSEDNDSKQWIGKLFPVSSSANLNSISAYLPPLPPLKLPQPDSALAKGGTSVAHKIIKSLARFDVL